MISTPAHNAVFRRCGRAARAAHRARQARRALRSCRLCAHRCGINRVAGEKGPCHAGPSARVFSAQTEVSDELELTPTFAIALSGCDMRCAFCITGRESWNPDAGVLLDAREIARQATEALRRKARTVMILGGEPTVFLPDALDIVARLPDTARVIWKTNARAGAQARYFLDGIFDGWVADFKFGNDACAERLSRVTRYTPVVRANLLWAAERTDLIVRHLLMPGHVECCWLPIARWLTRRMPAVKVSLRTGFWPAWKAIRHPELRHSCTPREIERAMTIADDFSLNLVP